MEDGRWRHSDVDNKKNGKLAGTRDRVSSWWFLALSGPDPGQPRENTVEQGFTKTGETLKVPDLGRAGLGMESEARGSKPTLHSSHGRTITTPSLVRGSGKTPSCLGSVPLGSKPSHPPAGSPQTTGHDR